MSKAVAAFITLALAFAVSSSAQAAKVQPEKVKSTVSVGVRSQQANPQIKQFLGKVESVEEGCSVGRRVTVKMSRPGPDLNIAWDYTDKDGKWNTGFLNPDGDRFYATIEQKTIGSFTCLADSSRAVDISGPSGGGSTPKERFESRFIDFQLHKTAAGRRTGRFGGIVYATRLGSLASTTKCKEDRTVLIMMATSGPDEVVARATTKVGGNWGAEPDRLEDGSYYAYVEPVIVDGYLCQAAFSQRITVK